MLVPWYARGAPRPDWAKPKPKPAPKGPDHLGARSGSANYRGGDQIVGKTPVRPAPYPNWVPQQPITPMPNTAAPAPTVVLAQAPQPLPQTVMGGGPLGSTSDFVVVQPTAAVTGTNPYNPLDRAASQQGWSVADWFARQQEAKPEVVRPAYTPKLTALDRALQRTWGNLENEGASGLVRAEKEGRIPRPRSEQMIENVVNHYNQMAERGKVAMTRAEGKKKDRKENFKELTLEDWNALNADQQAAVQWNADLQTAVQADTAAQVVPTEEQRETYDKNLQSLFGTTPGVGLDEVEYAPNTVGMLLERGLSRTDKLGTLDDFLRMDTAISAKQIRNLGRELPTPTAGETFTMQTPTGVNLQLGLTNDALTPKQERLALAQRLAAAQKEFQATLTPELARGKKLLANWTPELAGNETAQEMGAPAKRTPLKELKATEEEARLAMDYLGGLVRKDLDPAESMKMIETSFVERGIEPDVQSRVWEIMQAGALEAATNPEAAWFPELKQQGLKLHTPQQVSQILGGTPMKMGG